MHLPGIEFTLVEPRRVYLGGRRYHHGLYGLWRIATGIALVAMDWHDRRVWVRDFLQHPAWKR